MRPKGGRHTVKNADTALLTLEQAEKILGFEQQVISRWAKKLSARDEYREAISRAVRRLGLKRLPISGKALSRRG